MYVAKLHIHVLVLGSLTVITPYRQYTVIGFFKSFAKKLRFMDNKFVLKTHLHVQCSYPISHVYIFVFSNSAGDSLKSQTPINVWVVVSNPLFFSLFFSFFILHFIIFFQSKM